MSELQDLCMTLEAIDGEILAMARDLHRRAQTYSQAANRAAAAARSAEGDAAAALTRTANALAAAAKYCGQAAMSLTGASREGQAFVKRTVGALARGTSEASAAPTGGGRSAKSSHSLSSLLGRLAVLRGGESLSTHPEIQQAVVAGVAQAEESLVRWNEDDRACVRRWFGDDSHTNRGRLMLLVSAMKRDLSRIQLYPFEPGHGGPRMYAYVYPSDSERRIFVGEAFWNAGSQPPDAQAGVLFHELSHFLSIGGTRDHAYGVDAARELAVHDSERTLENADNIEYYMEEFL